MVEAGDDLGSRVASLEAYGKVNQRSIADLRDEVKVVAAGVEEIRRELHGARIAGRIGLGLMMILGSIIGFVVQTLKG